MTTAQPKKQRILKKVDHNAVYFSKFSEALPEASSRKRLPIPSQPRVAADKPRIIQAAPLEKSQSRKRVPADKIFVVYSSDSESDCDDGHISSDEDLGESDTDKPKPKPSDIDIIHHIASLDLEDTPQRKPNYESQTTRSIEENHPTSRPTTASSNDANAILT
jgi:hypothetical protein